ncbi:hypothetical protein NHH03_00055 [Stieleria sp. TO1_6]|uniref:hypothetical protein n=1 Tax=Stieleria tagensis TaxID=2956795 RepID=UPI00209A76A6|nr:hypothetical protein [Stieleria tagensis]MCO8120111.1 hypothetical protein [Stieleria tagensis]
MPITETSTTSRAWILMAVLLIGVPIVLCGGPLTWWMARRSNAFSTLHQRRDEIVARGLPIDDQTMMEYRSAQMDHQRSERWMKLLDQLEAAEFKTACREIPILGTPEDEVAFVPGQPYPYDRQVQVFLAEHSDLLKELHQIVEGSGAIWTKADFDSFNTLLPYIQATRTAVRLLSLELEDAIRRDDHDQVFDSLVAMIGVARSLEKEPVLVSQLVRIAIVGITVQYSKQAIELDLLDGEQLSALLTQYRALDDFGSGYRIAIIGERAMSQPMFDNVQRLSDPRATHSMNLNQRPLDALASLDYMQRAESIPTDDLNSFYHEIVALDADFQAQRAEANWLNQYETLMTELTAPALAAYGNAIVRSTMSTRLVKLAIGLRLYEKRHGRWPDTLGQLSADQSVGDLGPTEPVGHKPFGYRVTDGRAELWGFRAETPFESTPESPTDLTALGESEGENLAVWNWLLERSE